MQPRRISKAKSPIKSHSHTKKSFANHRSQNYYDATNFLWVETSAFIQDLQMLNARCFQFGRLSKTDGQVPGHESSCLQCHCFPPWTCSARVPTSDMSQTVKLQRKPLIRRRSCNIVQALKNRKLYSRFSRSGSKMVILKKNPEEPPGTRSVLPQLQAKCLIDTAGTNTAQSREVGVGTSRAWEVERSGTEMAVGQNLTWFCLRWFLIFGLS